jgi:prophage regulatory protein
LKLQFYLFKEVYTLTEIKLINNYLEQLSNRINSNIAEFKFLNKHIDDIRTALYSVEESVRSTVKDNYEPITKKPFIDHRYPNDLIRIKEVIQMTGTSRSFIYSHINQGHFPKPIQLGARAVAWQRHEVDEWVLNKINTKG